MDPKEKEAHRILARYEILKVGKEFLVPARGDTELPSVVYAVELRPQKCSCGDFVPGRPACAHILAAQIHLEQESGRVRKPRNWQAINAAKVNEPRLLRTLLADLCSMLETPEPGVQGGRRRISMPDVVFSLVMKVYTGLTGRDVMDRLEEAKNKKLISVVPHYNSLFAYMADPAITPILSELIAVAASPLQPLESGFVAVDSTGFGTFRFARWSLEDKKKKKDRRDWRKLHIMCGEKTHVVPAAKVSAPNAHDTRFLPYLLRKTQEVFKVAVVTADAAYPSVTNFDAIVDAGALPRIMFKKNATGGVGGEYQKAFRYFQFFREDFLHGYHTRSQVEATFSAIKRKFWEIVWSKSDVAIENEILCKVLCHNICCLIQCIYEFGIEAEFWPKTDSD